MNDEPGQAAEAIPQSVATVYSVIWRWLMMSVSRYGSLPSGELLVIVTLIVLDRAGYHPTVSDLAEITGMPKSSISRYVSGQMGDGFLEEYIDPKDRRRRRLRPTVLARDELRDIWYTSIPEIFEPVLNDHESPILRPNATVDQVMQYLRDVGASALPRVGTRRG